jgi:DNA-binding response OmpR family regulator
MFDSHGFDYAMSDPAMKVLVIEDDRSIRETLGIVLESYGHQAELLPSGELALQSLEAGWPDVMLLDLTLEGMSGEELYRQVRERYGSAPPTVVLSAVQQAEKRAQAMPGVRFLAKPYTLDELMNILEEAARSRRAA